MKNRKLIISISICILLIICIIFVVLFCSNKISNNDIIYNENDKIIEPINVSEIDDIDRNILSNVMDTYCKLNNKLSNNDMVNFLALSDLHYLGEYGDISNLDIILNKINTLSKLENMDFVISLGDLNNAIENREVSLKNLQDITLKFKQFSVPTLFALGNHDRFIKNESQYDITESEYFNTTFSDFDSSYIFNTNVSNKPYYYRDIEDKKIRICVLNCFSDGNYEYVIDNEQLKFVGEKILNFSEKEDANEWTITFFIHTILPTEVHQENVEGAEILLNILKAYKNGEKYIFDNNEFDFSSVERANVAAIFTGHHHFDYTLEKDGILIIGISTILSKHDRGDTDLYSSWSEINSDLGFEIISIDTKNKIIYSTKVGNSENRFWSY